VIIYGYQIYPLPTLPPGVNFTNILLAAFAPKSFRQKITNPTCKHIKAMQKKLLYKKSAHKILVKMRPGGREWPLNYPNL
jgi:hypothetical protein